VFSIYSPSPSPFVYFPFFSLISYNTPPYRIPSSTSTPKSQSTVPNNLLHHKCKFSKPLTVPNLPSPSCLLLLHLHASTSQTPAFLLILHHSSKNCPVPYKFIPSITLSTHPSHPIVQLPSSRTQSLPLSASLSVTQSPQPNTSPNFITPTRSVAPAYKSFHLNQPF